MAYTNIASVRLESDLTDVTNVPDSTVTGYINSSHSIVLSRIGSVYDLTQLGTNFSGSNAEEYLKRAETLITSGSLINGEIVQDSLGEFNYGDKKLNMGYAMLDKVVMQEVILFNTNNEQFAIKKIGKNGVLSKLGERDTTNDSFTYKQVF